MLYVVESVQLDLTSSDSEITLMPGTYCIELGCGEGRILVNLLMLAAVINSSCDAHRSGGSGTLLCAAL